MIVLLVVPSLVIVQQDVARLFRAWRRGLFGRHRAGPHRVILAGATVAALALVMATMGMWVVNGGAPGLLARAAGIGGLGGTFVALLIGLLIIVIAALVAGARALRAAPLPNDPDRSSTAKVVVSMILLAGRFRARTAPNTPEEGDR